MSVADQLYTRFKNAGVEVLLDGRDERAGVKFKDSDLISIPFRITIGKQAGEGLVELKECSGAEQKVIIIEEVFAGIIELVNK